MSGELQPGSVFEGRYRIDGVLGRGGFSIVYDAHDLDYERRVALKIVSTQGERYNGPTRARFDREISAVAELDNPHAVEVYEFGSTFDGDLYAVFEYIPGRDLAEILNEQERLPPAVVEHILRQLLVALADAHRAQILHRDLKPENVRVFEQDGDPWRVKLLDFGIARPAHALSSSVTKTGELIGTPRYMSPEQLTDTRLTAASDIYSLGVVAFELIAGREALGGNSWSDQLDRLQSGHHFSVAAIREAERLQIVIDKMTGFELSDRLGTAQAVLDALGEDPDITVDDDPDADETEFVVARPPTLPEHSTTSRRSRSSNLIMVFATAGLVVVGGLVAIASTSGDVEDDTPSLPAALLAPPQRRAAAAAPVTPAVDVELDVSAAPNDTSPAVVAPLSGCGKEQPFVGRGQLASKVELDREPWHVYIPKSYDPQVEAPLIMLLHDRLQHAGKLLTGSGLQEIAEEHGIVVVAPVDRSLLAWLDESDRQMVYDVFEETATRLCIDRKRVFLIAQGNAGETAVPVACQPWVTGIATNSYRRASDVFGCDRAVPMLMMSPLHSRHEKIEGGKNCKGTRQMALSDVEAMWRVRNHCTGDPVLAFQHRGSTCQRWTCDVPFESCHIDGGRNWPGGPPRHSTDLDCEGPPHRFPTAAHAWRFFSSLDAASD